MTKHNSFFNSFLDNLVFPILVIVIAPIITGVGSKVKTGDYLSWASKVPKIGFVLFALIMGLWVVIILVRKRMKYIRDLDSGPDILVDRTPLYGWDVIGESTFSGVVWYLITPSVGPGEIFNHNNISSYAIEIETPPRCPKCKTELEESNSFWGGYKWHCVRCNFKKRNKDSYNLEADRAKRIARREWEEQRE